MTEALFYHLEKARIDSVLPELLERTLERGWRALVRCGDRASVERVDELLWTYRDDSFMPHSADPALADRDPVHITDNAKLSNGADLLFLVEGARADAARIGAYKRCVLIFNGADEAELAAARAFWKEANANGAETTYWRQSSEGRWKKQE
jgi:DNA polymerase-3 subunit chi